MDERTEIRLCSGEQGYDSISPKLTLMGAQSYVVASRGSLIIWLPSPYSRTCLSGERYILESAVIWNHEGHNTPDDRLDLTVRFWGNTALNPRQIVLGFPCEYPTRSSSEPGHGSRVKLPKLELVTMSFVGTPDQGNCGSGEHTDERKSRLKKTMNDCLETTPSVYLRLDNK